MFAGLIAAALAVGSGAPYLITKNSRSVQPQERVVEKVVEIEKSPAAHFTAYQAADYPDLTYAAENAVNAVVNIEVTQQVQMRNVDPFLEFFGIPQGYSRGGEYVPREFKAGGSGVIISQDGYIVTNHHVVDNATELKVKLYDGRTFQAKVVGTDPTTEVALIKIEGENLPTLAFGDSDALRLGEWVLAIGSPFDLQSTITAGIVSAKSRNLGAIPNQYRVESFIQTDAAVNPGNSGGALVNTRGELVGINTLIKSQTGTYMGYSFAIPSAIVKKVVVDLKEYGVVQRALLGVSYREIDEEFVEAFGEEYGIRETGGVYVADVSEDGAAKAAGMIVYPAPSFRHIAVQSQVDITGINLIPKGDVITAIDGIRLGNNTNLAEIMSRYRPNDKVTISVKRDGKTKQFEVVLRNKAGKAELLSRDYVDVAESLGGRFAEINDRTRRELRIENGIRVTEVRPGGVLARARVKEGFVITHINDRPIRSVADLDRVTGPVTYIEGVYPNGRAISYSLVQ